MSGISIFWCFPLLSWLGVCRSYPRCQTDQVLSNFMAVSMAKHPTNHENYPWNNAWAIYNSIMILYAKLKCFPNCGGFPTNYRTYTELVQFQGRQRQEQWSGRQKHHTVFMVPNGCKIRQILEPSFKLRIRIWILPGLKDSYSFSNDSTKRQVLQVWKCPGAVFSSGLHLHPTSQWWKWSGLISMSSFGLGKRWAWDHISTPNPSKFMPGIYKWYIFSTWRI